MKNIEKYQRYKAITIWVKFPRGKYMAIIFIGVLKFQPNAYNKI